LSRCGRRGERPVRLHQILEGAAYLGRRHGAEAGAPRRNVRLLASQRLEGLHADELALPIVVRCEDDLVRRFCESAERFMEGFRRLPSNRFDIDESVETRELPVPQFIRVVDLDDVTSKREHDRVISVTREREVAEAVCPDLLSHPF